MRALIISGDGFEDTELRVPLEDLRASGVVTDVASPHGGDIHGKHGYRVKTDLKVEDADPAAYDLLVLPGGKAPAKLREESAILDLVREFFAATKPVAAICHGPQILISAGVMKGRTATCHHSVAGELQAAGAHYIDEEVVVTDKLITSRNPADLPAFMRAIKERLGIGK